MAPSLQRKDSDAELTLPGQKSDMIYIWGKKTVLWSTLERPVSGYNAFSYSFSARNLMYHILNNITSVTKQEKAQQEPARCSVFNTSSDTYGGGNKSSCKL